MSKNKLLKLKLSAAIVLIFVVGIAAVYGGVKAYQSYGDAPKVVVEGNYIEASGPVEKMGAVASPDIPFNWLSVGGVREWAYSMTPNTATTTICAFASPAATSTLDFASVALTTSSSTASIITVAKAATAYATTTVISSPITISANAQAEIVASSTYSNQAAWVFGPSQYLVVGMQGGVGTMSPAGTCKVRWIQLSD